MARRYLGLSTAEWDALSWWEQQMYIEGYEWEGLVESGGGSQAAIGAPANMQHTVFSGVPGEMAATGLSERTL